MGWVGSSTNQLGLVGPACRTTRFYWERGLVCHILAPIISLVLGVKSNVWYVWDRPGIFYHMVWQRYRIIYKNRDIRGKTSHWRTCPTKFYHILWQRYRIFYKHRDIRGKNVTLTNLPHKVLWRTNPFDLRLENRKILHINLESR